MNKSLSHFISQNIKWNFEDNDQYESNFSYGLQNFYYYPESSIRNLINEIKILEPTENNDIDLSDFKRKVDSLYFVIIIRDFSLIIELTSINEFIYDKNKIKNQIILNKVLQLINFLNFNTKIYYDLLSENKKFSYDNTLGIDSILYQMIKNKINLLTLFSTPIENNKTNYSKIYLYRQKLIQQLFSCQFDMTKLDDDYLEYYVLINVDNCSIDKIQLIINNFKIEKLLSKIFLFFQTISSYYKVEPLYKLISYINGDHLSCSDMSGGKNSWHYLFTGINNEHHVEVIKIILPLFSNSVKLFEDYSGVKPLDTIFKNIKNKYQVETIKLLLPHFTKNELPAWNDLLGNISCSAQVELVKVLLPYLSPKDLKNNSVLHEFFIYFNEFKLEVLKLILPYLEKTHMKFKNENGESCWNVFFKFSLSYSEVQALELLLPLLEEEDFMDSSFTGDLITFYQMSQIENPIRVNLLKLILPFLSKKIFSIKKCGNDKTGRNSWHFFFSNFIDNEYYIDILNLLINFLDKDLLKEKDGEGKTCWHHLFKFINNNFSYQIFLILLPYLEKNDLKEKDNNGNTILHYLFFGFYNQFIADTLRSLLPLLEIEDLKIAGMNKKTILETIFVPSKNVFQNRIISDIKPLLNDEELVKYSTFYN